MVLKPVPPPAEQSEGTDTLERASLGAEGADEAAGPGAPEANS
jgi:hypothetical protein